MTNIRRRAAVAGGLAAAAAPLVPIRVWAKTRTVRVGDTAPLALSWPLFIADKKGFQAAEGIQVETTYTNSNPAVAQQAVGGSFDIGVTTYETGVRAIVAGAPLSLIASLMRAFPYAVMVPMDIRTPADLRGKRVMLTLRKSLLTAHASPHFA